MAVAVQLEHYGIPQGDMEKEAAAAAAGEGCALRVLLLPFGIDKAELDEYDVSGHLK